MGQVVCVGACLVKQYAQKILCMDQNVRGVHVPECIFLLSVSMFCMTDNGQHV